ncbi:MAG: hypothetical protein H7243_10560 [Sphingomonadaceae bacterium]|nr:hypothetical protein [Sphingomonadaceae bacterium]
MPITPPMTQSRHDERPRDQQAGRDLEDAEKFGSAAGAENAKQSSDQRVVHDEPGNPRLFIFREL